MLHAQGDVMLFTDADLSSPIYEADKLFAAIEQGADVAIGSRWLQAELQTERQPWHRQLYGRLFNLALRIVLGLKYRDTQCGFKAFTRAAAQTIFTRQRIERWGFDPELLFLADKFKSAHGRGSGGVGARSSLEDQPAARRHQDGRRNAKGSLERHARAL